MGFLNVFGYNYWGVVQDRLSQHPGTVNCMLPDSFESNILYTGCSDGCIRSLSLHPNSINGIICCLNDSVEKMQIFETMIDESTFRFIIASTCADSVLVLTDIKNVKKKDEESIQISKKRKIAEVDKDKEMKKIFFADLE